MILLCTIRGLVYRLKRIIFPITEQTMNMVAYNHLRLFTNHYFDKWEMPDEDREKNIHYITTLMVCDTENGTFSRKKIDNIIADITKDYHKIDASV